MNEKEKARRFNRHLDMFLKEMVSEPTLEYAQEERELLALAGELQALTDQDLNRRKQVQQKRLLAVEQKINATSKGMKAMFRNQSLRLSVAVLLFIFLIAASVAFREPLTALAQEILYQIGIWEIDNEPTSVEIHALQWTPIPTMDFTPEPEFIPESGFIFRNLSVEQVEAESGFPILVSGYLPQGFERVLRDNFILIDELRVDTIYLNPADIDNILVLSQIRLLSDEELERYQHLPNAGVINREDPGLPEIPYYTGSPLFYGYDVHGGEDNQGLLPFSVGDAPVVEVTVRNRPGVWIEQTNWAAIQDPINHQLQPIGMNFLIWEDDGFTIWLKSFDLPLREMLKIAEGLHLSSEAQ